MQAIKDKQHTMSIRSVLKAGMVSQTDGKQKKAAKKKALFSRAMLGTLPPAALHGILTAVVAANPEALEDLYKPDMVALVQAYDPTRPGAKGSKADLKAELVGAIVAHEKFTDVTSSKLFKI